MKTIVTNDNQVPVPVGLAEELGIRPGPAIDWSKGTDGTLIARPLKNRAEIAKQICGIGRDWLKPGDDPVNDLIRERIQENGSE